MRGSNPQKRFKNIGVMTVPFGGKTRGEDFHPAVDLANRIGTPIPSVSDGVVTNVISGKPQGSNDFGNSVEIKDKNGDTAQYHHLQKVNVSLGQRINKRQPIGTMGNSGNTYSASGLGDGSHLDLRIVNAFGRYKNPTPYLTNL